MNIRMLIVLASLVAVPAVLLAEETSTNESTPEPVDFRKLKELLPEKVLDLKRTKADGEKLKMGEMVMSRANASYGNDEEENAPTIDIALLDYSALKGAGEMFAAWAAMEIDREGDDGYQRTLKIKDQPAHEQYYTESKSGQLQIWVAGRYLVTVDARNVTTDQFKKLADAVDVKKLAELK